MTISKELSDLLFQGEDLTVPERLDKLLRKNGYESDDKLAKDINSRINLSNADVQEITPKEAANWRTSGTIPEEYYLVFSSVLGINEIHWRAIFTKTKIKNVSTKLLRADNGFKHGYFADFLGFVILMQRTKRVEKFLPKIGIYEASLIGILRGEILPSRKLADKISKALSGNGKATEAFMRLIELDRSRLGTKETFFSDIFGDIDTDTTIGQVFNALIADQPNFQAATFAQDKPGFDLHKFYKFRKNPNVQHRVEPQMVEGLRTTIKSLLPKQNKYGKIIDECLERKRPKERFEAILLDYLATAKEITMKGFIDTVQTEWVISREALGKTLGHRNGKTLKNWSNPSFKARSEDIRKAFKAVGFREEESKLEFIALVNGAHPGVSIDDLCDQAQAILESDPENIPDEFENNLIYQRMHSKGFLVEGQIDKSKVSCSLYDILFERSGLTRPFLEERMGSAYKYGRFNRIINGERTPTIYPSKGTLIEMVEKAREVAKIFTDSSDKIGRLELLFQGIVKKQSPKQLLEKVKQGEIRAGEAVLIYRRQECLAKDAFLKELEAHNGTICRVTLNYLESHNTKISTENNALAIARTIGFAEGFKGEQEFARALMGKVTRGITLEALNKAVDKAMEEGSNLEFKHFIRPIQKFLKVTTYKELGDLIITSDHPNGISSTSVECWLKGGKDDRKGKIGTEEVAEALVDLVGFDEKRRNNFIRIAMGRDLHYNPDIVDNLSTASTAQERRDAITYLREFAGHSKLSIYPLLNMGKNFYGGFERRGGFDPNTIKVHTEKRDGFLADLVYILIPEGFDRQKEHLKDVLSSPFPEQAVAR